MVVSTNEIDWWDVNFGRILTVEHIYLCIRPWRLNLENITVGTESKWTNFRQN